MRTLLQSRHHRQRRFLLHHVEEKEKLLKRAAQLRPDWESPHVQLALLAEPWGYQQMIAEWTAALKFGPDDPFYAAKLKEAQEKFATQKLDLAENFFLC